MVKKLKKMLLYVADVCSTAKENVRLKKELRECKNTLNSLSDAHEKLSKKYFALIGNAPEKWKTCKKYNPWE